MKNLTYSITLLQPTGLFSKQFFKNKLPSFVIPLLLTTPVSDLTKTINKLWYSYVLLISLLFIFLILFLYLNQRSQKRNNHLLINALKDNNDVLTIRVITGITKIQNVKESKITNKVKISPDRKVPIKIVAQIKKSLEKFEKKQGFLDPNLKLTKLAEQFETNTKYLAKVISEEKCTSYKDYIKDLKIVFAKSRIDTEYKFRRYKIEVIANECGFKTGESFSKCFLQKYGVYPSKYIKKIEAEAKNI